MPSLAKVSTWWITAVRVHVAAAPQHHLGCALEDDLLALAPQSCSVAMNWLALSNGIVSSRACCLRARRSVDAELLPGDHERAFGRVAGDLPAAFHLLQGGVAAEDAGQQQFVHVVGGWE